MKIEEASVLQISMYTPTKLSLEALPGSLRLLLFSLLQSSLLPYLQ